MATPVLDKNLNFLVALADFHGPLVIPFANHELKTSVVSGKTDAEIHFNRSAHRKHITSAPGTVAAGHHRQLPAASGYSGKCREWLLPETNP
ncbi:hypothetical protein ACGYV2_32840, partial [Burkholderia pseudomallei]